MTDFVRLLDAVDIGLILSDRETQLDWGYIEDRLRTKSVYAAVLLTLESAVRWLKLNGRLIGLPPPGHLRRRWFHTVWHVDCESYAMRRAYRAHKLRFTMLEAGRPKDKARFVGALVSPKREWVAAFFDRPYHPWLRIRFLLLVIRGRVGLRPTGNP
jgi:hypothetical protein